MGQLFGIVRIEILHIFTGRGCEEETRVDTCTWEKIADEWQCASGCTKYPTGEIIIGDDAWHKSVRAKENLQG